MILSVQGHLFMLVIAPNVDEMLNRLLTKGRVPWGGVNPGVRVSPR